jgi:predicted ATPase
VVQPARGVHPWLIAELLAHFRGYTETGQLILTTHNPLIVDAAKGEEVVIVEKVDAMTTARRASSNEDVEVFLKRFTLGELWHQGN